MYFNAFSSKSECETNIVNNYKQSCSINFKCCSFTGKEPRKGKRIPLNKIKYNEQRDEETGYGYFGARYMDHELMTMWLSVDPMADKYPSISPYAYCAWNPMKLVDPDGLEAVDDWYEDVQGNVRWDANVHSQKDLKNNERYIGQTARMISEGGDAIIYGDQYGHRHSSIPLREVTFVKTLTDFERTMRNPLVQSIHQSAGKFLETSLNIGLETCAQTFTYCGLGTQTISFYSMMVPGGEILGTELYAIGNTMARIGMGFDAINNIRKGDRVGLALDAVSLGFPIGISWQIKKGLSSGLISASSREVTLLDAYISTRTGCAVEAVNMGRGK